jgi:hypothetical protein
MMLECQEDGCLSGPIPTALGWEHNPQSLGALHHDHTGHVVRVEKYVVTRYGEDQPGQRRWWKASARS